MGNTRVALLVFAVAALAASGAMAFVISDSRTGGGQAQFSPAPADGEPPPLSLEDVRLALEETGADLVRDEAQPELADGVQPTPVETERLALAGATATGDEGITVLLFSQAEDAAAAVPSVRERASGLGTVRVEQAANAVVILSSGAARQEPLREAVRGLGGTRG